MSTVPLSIAKAFLNVIHNADDIILLQLLNGAEAEALNFLDRTDFGSIVMCNEASSGTMILPADAQLGVLILLQAAYQASPDEAEQLRRVAEVKLMPYRRNLGV